MGINDEKKLGVITSQNDIEKIKESLLKNYEKLCKIGKLPDYEKLGKYDTLRATFTAQVFNFAAIRFNSLSDIRTQTKKVANRNLEIMEYCNSLVKKICEGKFQIDDTKGDFFGRLYSELKQFVIMPETPQEMSNSINGITFSKKDGYFEKDSTNEINNCKPDEYLFKELKALEKILRTTNRGHSFSDTQYSQETITWLSEQLKVSEKKVLFLIEISTIRSESLIFVNSDGEEISKIDSEEFVETHSLLFDKTKADYNLFNEPEKIPDTIPFFDEMDEVFSKKQERTKKYISALITQDILTEVNRSYKNKKNLDLNLIYKYLAKYSFTDSLQLEEWLNNSHIFSKTEIAKTFGKTLDDASRTLSHFKKSLLEKK